MSYRFTRKVRMWMNKMAYPKVANFDDQISSKNDVLYYVFSFGETFQYYELTQTSRHLRIEQDIYELKGNTLCCNGLPWVAHQHESNVTIIKKQDLEVLITPYPKATLTIMNSSNAHIQIKGTAVVTITPVYDTKGKILQYSMYLIANKSICYVNGIKVQKRTSTFYVGDHVVVDGISIQRLQTQFKLTGISQELVLHKEYLIKIPYVADYPIDYPEYRRSPRIFHVAPEDKVSIKSPGEEPTDGKNELTKMILPPMVMVGTTVLTSVLSGGNPIMMLGMASASVVTTAMSVTSFVSNKKDTKIKVKRRIEDYEHYLLEKQSQLNELRDKQYKALHYHYPSIKELMGMIQQYSPRIYERTCNHDDFLSFSLGYGTIKPTYQIDFQEDDYKDPLIEYTKNEIVIPRKTLSEAPITTTLLGQTLGFAGHYPIIKTAISTLLFQIATFQSYHDVEFICLVPEESYQNDWYWLRWLPHFQLKALNLRGFVHNSRSRDMLLNSFLQIMNKRKQKYREAENEKPKYAPHYILAILDDTYLAGHGLNEFLAEDMSIYGVTVIWGKEASSMLPETVTTMVRYFSSQAAELVNENQVLVAKRFVPNNIPHMKEMQTTIHRLANLHHMEVEKNAIPDAVTFLEMYQVSKVEELQVKERWEKANTAKTLAVPLGLRGKDDVVELNLHERAHGPHGLIAGTTGVGKSEIVQSYVLSLAINFSPEDVGFLPIDFKGGGMANEFKNLPHLMGSITNLDGASSARALASIRAESRKRQRLLSQYGVNNVNKYTKLYKRGQETTDEQEKMMLPTQPMPHLFLISDEFAELKANEPEFMDELVSIARIGRSLGIHLILATQKPSGVVSDQIWSNSKFKLCLKVADESDSNEVLKTPDAAHIVLPGRAYLQVGLNEIYELFQSAWSGAPYHANLVTKDKIDNRVWFINELGQHELLTSDLSAEDDELSEGSSEELPSQLQAIVNHIASITNEMNVVLPEKPWLPPLEEMIVSPFIQRAECWSIPRKLSVPWALQDEPSKQRQTSYMFDIEQCGHTVIHGSAGFGKSTLLQTLVMNLARQNNPMQVQFHLFDFGTNGLLPLKNLPHVSDITRLDEVEKIEKFATRIRNEISERKDVFTKIGVSSLSQYEEKTKSVLPIIITIVDGYDSLKDQPVEEYMDGTLNQLLRDGASVGMYLIMTGLRANTLKISMISNVPTRIALFLVEENAVKDVVGRDALIQEEIVGRGQMKLDENVCMQFYLAIEGDSDLERLVKLEEEINEMNQEWTGDKPKAIPLVPQVVSHAHFFALDDVLSFIEKGNITLALSMETTEAIGYRPLEDKFFLIADGEPSHTLYLENTIIESFRRLHGTYERIILDGQDRYAHAGDAFDKIVSSLEISNYVNTLLEAMSKEISSPEADHSQKLIYISDVQVFADKTMMTEQQIRKLLREAHKVGVYLLFHGEKNKIEVGYDDVNRILRVEASSGLVGSKLSDQQFVKIKSNFNEPLIEHDQNHYYCERDVVKVKLVSEW